MPKGRARTTTRTAVNQSPAIRQQRQGYQQRGGQVNQFTASEIGVGIAAGLNYYLSSRTQGARSATRQTRSGKTQEKVMHAGGSQTS